MDKENLLKELGGRIRHLRKINRWTQSELAVMCGYNSKSSSSTINKIESGNCDISISKLVDFADAFNVTAAYLIGESVDEHIEEQIAKNNAMVIIRNKLSKKEQEDVIRGLSLFLEDNRADLNEML